MRVDIAGKNNANCLGCLVSWRELVELIRPASFSPVLWIARKTVSFTGFVMNVIVGFTVVCNWMPFVVIYIALFFKTSTYMCVNLTGEVKEPKRFDIDN